MTTDTDNKNTFHDSPERKSSKTSLSTIATELLREPSINELPLEEQGRVISDRFIGALVRHGAIETSNGSYNAADILNLMDSVGKTGPGVMAITRSEGLREGVVALARDERVGKLFGNFSSQLGTDGNVGADEKFTLTSAAQIEGYLLAGGDKNIITDGVGGVHMPGSEWVGVIAEHAERMSDDPYLSWMTEAKARELTTSSAPLIRNTGRDWQMARASAEKAGIDLDLLKRSTEKLQERKKVGHDLGKTALFVATNGRIQAYKQNLNRRSGW